MKSNDDCAEGMVCKEINPVVRDPKEKVQEISDHISAEVRLDEQIDSVIAICKEGLNVCHDVELRLMKQSNSCKCATRPVYIQIASLAHPLLVAVAKQETFCNCSSEKFTMQLAF